MEMEDLLRDSVPMVSVSLAVSAAALYSRAVSSRVTPGFPRLTMLVPVGAFFAAAPLAFSSAILRCVAALFLAWLGTFKVGLLAAGRGPLADPGLPALHFVLAVALPIELGSSSGRSKPEPVSSLVRSTLNAAVLAATTLRLYQLLHWLHPHARLALYGVHAGCSMVLVFSCAAAACGALGVEVKPQFVRPHLASSLRDFWGRRWNLPVSAVLRASVYDPLRRRRAGKEAAVLATFAVSGLMHEALVYYLTLRWPTGEMAAYLLLHGACRVAEEWWAARGWPPPPRPVATLLTWVFLMGTAFWLLFPPVCRDGREKMLLKETEAVAAFISGAGRKLLGLDTCT